MRKTLIVFLALALVCACGAAVCTHAVAAPREDVTFDEHVFAGDPAAAAGLQVQLQAALRQNLFWDSTVRFSGRDYTADTAFRFSPVAVSREQPRQYSGVEVDTRVNVWTDSDTNPFGSSPGRPAQRSSASRIIMTSIRSGSPSICRTCLSPRLTDGTITTHTPPMQNGTPYMPCGTFSASRCFRTSTWSCRSTRIWTAAAPAMAPQACSRATGTGQAQRAS